MDINNEPMINEEINDREVRLIGPEGEQLGVMTGHVALQKAEEAGLDLVKIVPGARPPSAPKWSTLGTGTGCCVTPATNTTRNVNARCPAPAGSPTDRAALNGWRNRRSALN